MSPLTAPSHTGSQPSPDPPPSRSSRAGGGIHPAGRAPLQRLRAHLEAPVDAASSSVFRILFGVVLAVGAIRALASGWIEEVLVAPTFFFKYAGFEWVPVWDLWPLRALLAAVALAAICIALGLFYRAATLAFLLGFTMLQLMDLTNYLNHYYLAVLLAALLLVLPLGRHWSLDARRRPERRCATVPRWVVYLLRFQLAMVYLHAGLAKINSDWLLHAQPLQIWLNARGETPIIGPWLDQLWVAYAMAWAGCIYDCTIWLWLSWRRTRPYAYLVVLVFHGMTQVFFDIGIFPTIMTTLTLIFFAPDWPRALIRRLSRRGVADAPTPQVTAPTRLGPARAAAYAVAVAWCAFHLLFPLRSHVMGRDVLWDEVGMRYAWKVMLREKQGSVTYRVRTPNRSREYEINPREYLEWRQVSEMSSQPDFIVQLAHHIADDFRRRGAGEPEVRVDAWVSLNGRRPARLIDPDVDLVHLSAGASPWTWITAAPSEPPPRIARVDRRGHPPREASR